jgi:DNA repair exonuclease SbcCD nuclease subunit
MRGLEGDPDAPAARIRGATRAAFSNLVDFAISESVALVLIAGDIYDGDWLDYRTGQFLVRELGRLTRAGIRVIAISGNHDAASVITRTLRWPAGATLLRHEAAETIRLGELGLSIHGRSFADREVLENLVPNYPDADPGHLNFGLLHTAATGRPGHASYAPCTLEQLRNKNYDYWALGHIHAREVLCQDPFVVFPGNLQGRHCNEDGPKGATLITVADGRIAGVKHHTLDDVRWARITLDLTGTADEDKLLDQARQAFDAAVADAAPRLVAARLTLRGNTPLHAALLRDAASLREKLRAEAAAAAGGGALWLEYVSLATTSAASAQPPEGLALALLQRLDDPLADIQPLRDWAAGLLGRAGGLRAALGEDDAAPLVADGNLPPRIIEEARALLLARLGH